MREMEGREILRLYAKAKKARGKKSSSKSPLAGQIWALIFTKASTRTRVSFEVAIRELGGVPSFLSAAEIQLGRGELVRDTARVMGRMVHGAVIRTFAQGDVEEFAEFAKIPTINALTDDEHPCQILSDIFTIEEKRGSIRGKKVAFIGDAACNVPRSWAEAANIFDFQLICGAPKEFRPPSVGKHVSWTEDPIEAARGADVLYTDVWVSMGKESEVGLIEETLIVSVSAADDDRHGTGSLLPLVELGGELAAGEWRAVFVEDHAEVAFTAGEEVGAFAWFVGCFDRDVLDWREFGEAGEILVASGLGVDEGGFADGEQQPFHGC
jgi:ornithine carbamoyltransferase